MKQNQIETTLSFRLPDDTKSLACVIQKLSYYSIGSHVKFEDIIFPGDKKFGDFTEPVQREIIHIILIQKPRVVCEDGIFYGICWIHPDYHTDYNH